MSINKFFKRYLHFIDFSLKYCILKEDLKTRVQEESVEPEKIQEESVEPEKISAKIPLLLISPTTK
jgi:hypothetical protein